ncbi:unnamed protein product [Caenorhabditis nigoni]
MLVRYHMRIGHDTAQYQFSDKDCDANRLALLDTVTVLVFDFLPSFCGSMWPTAEIFSFDFVGPYNAVGKVTGCAIEAIAVSTLLIFRKGKNAEPKSSSNRRIAKNTKSSGQVLTFRC